MHIRPWEIDLLTYEQFERAAAAVDQYEKDMDTKTTEVEDE